MQALFAKKSVQNPPVGGNRYDLPRNELAGRLQGALGGIFQPAAAAAEDVVMSPIEINVPPLETLFFRPASLTSRTPFLRM